MTGTIIGVVCILLLLTGAVFGAQFQSGIQEGRRRRIAARIRELNAAQREMRRQRQPVRNGRDDDEEDD